MNGSDSIRVGEGLVPSRGRPQATASFRNITVSIGIAPNRSEVVALRATGGHKTLPYTEWRSPLIRNPF